MSSSKEEEELPGDAAGVVFGWEKEKLEKMGLSDCSPLENAAPGADQSGSNHEVRKKNRRAWVNFFEENVAGRRILRSDVAKQREREAVAAKKKALEEGAAGAQLEENTRSNGADKIECEGEIKVVKKRVLRSDTAKQRELTNTHVKKVMEEATVRDNQNVSSSVITDSNVTEIITCEEGMAVGEKRIKVDNGPKRVTEEDDIGGKKVTVKASPGTDQKEGCSAVSKDNGTGQIKCEDEVKVEERIRMSGVAGQMEEDGSDKIEVRDKVDRDTERITEELDDDKRTVTEQVVLEVDQSIDETTTRKRSDREVMQFDEELKVEEKRNLDLGPADQREMTDMDDYKGATGQTASGADNGGVSVMSKRNVTERVKYKEKIKNENKRVTRSSTAKQRAEAEADKKKLAEFDPAAGLNGNSSTFSTGTNMEQIRCEDRSTIEKRSEWSNNSKRHKEAGNCKNKIAELDKNIKCSTINKNNDLEMIECEEIEDEKNRVERSDPAMQQDGAATAKKKVMESHLKRKRSRDASDADTKIKTEASKSRQDQHEKTGETKMDIDSSTIRGSGPKSAEPVTGQKDCPSEKRMQPSLRKSSKLEDQKNRWNRQPGLKTLKILKDGAHQVDVKREEFSISQHKGIRGQGRGRGRGVLRFLPSNKKVGGFAKIHIRKEGEENTESLNSATIGGQKHSPFIGERKNFKKSGSALSSSKSLLNPGGVSSFEKEVPFEAKKEPNSLSLSKKSKKMNYSNGKGEDMANGRSKTSLLTKQEKEAEITGRRMAKQQLRDQIKKMLLDSGWKIELRPRKSKNYDDSVYVSPKGVGYWSITKAYDVLQKQFSCDRDGKSEDLSRKTFKTSQRKTSSSFSPIPMEVLNILKKTITKRRTKKQLEETGMKLGFGSRSKKLKKSNIKCSKNKHFKYKSGKVKMREKDNDTSGSSAKAVSYTYRKPRPGKSRKKQRGCALLVRGSNQETETGTDVYVPYAGKRTMFSWMIDLGIVPENARVKYTNQKQPHILEGHITRDGIQCSCCNKIFTVSRFEIHAGSTPCQPYQNIFVEEAGISLLQCQINAWEKQESEWRGFCSVDVHGDDPNDDTCGICGDGGDLICCDGCPSTFHLSCLGIEILPGGDWHCMNCSCRYCGVIYGDAAQGGDGIISPLLTCSQCEEKYHQRCVPDGDAVSVGSNISYVPFCGQSCRKLFKQLQMLLGVKNDLDAGFSWTLLQRFDEDLHESVRGLDQRAECNSKIAVALTVMDECFLPIIDQRSGINLIHNVVYNCGSNFSRLNYRGFYTFILEQDDEIISAASVRIHGTRVAEMPFIGTRNMYRRKGMCRRLLNEIESVLCSFNIEKLIIPAISDLMDTWINVFGFEPLEVSQKQEIRSINMLVFPGTGLLQKPLLKKDSAEQRKTAAQGTHDKPESQHHHVKELNPSCPVSISSMNSSKVSPKFPGAPIEPESPVLECKSPEAAASHELSSQPSAIYHDEPDTGNQFQVGSSLEPETNLLCEGTLCYNVPVKIGDAVVTKNLLPVNDTLRQHTSEVKFLSPDVTASAPSLPDIDGSSDQLQFEARQTIPHAVASTLQDIGEDNLSNVLCSVALSSDATHHCRFEVRSSSTAAFPPGHRFQASSEQILDEDSSIKDQISVLQPNFEVLGEILRQHHSDIINGPQDAGENKFLTYTEEPKIHIVREDIMHGILEPLQDQTSDIESMNVGLESNILSFSGAKSCDISGSSHCCYDVACAPKSNVDSHALHKEAENSGVSCPSKVGIMLKNSMVRASRSTIVASENRSDK